MTGGDIEAIVGGYHGDPFKVLGPHRIRSRGPARWEVRAFLPHADAAEVLWTDASAPMTRKHSEGFFVAQIEGEPRQYRLRIALSGNRGAVDLEDPYRFPPLLSDFDLHLHAEGTHYETYNMLGAHLVEVENVPGVRFAVWAPNA